MNYRVGEIQKTALEIYVLDPAVSEGDDVFPGVLSGSVLRLDDAGLAWRLIMDGANSADEDGDVQLRDALVALARRVGRSGVKGSR